MLDDLCVRDFYTPTTNYPHISAASNVHDAFTLMHKNLVSSNKHRTILVVDNEHRLKGYLTLRDLTHALKPDFLREHLPGRKDQQRFQGMPDDLSDLSLIWQEGFSHKIREASKRNVADVMTLIEDTVSLDDSFARCTYLMLLKDILILPVVEDKNVIGVVRIVQVFEHIAQSLQQNT